jgi:hypothetical protein
MVARIRIKENILTRSASLFVNIERVKAEEEEHCYSCRNFDVVIERLTNLNLQTTQGRL